MANQREASRQNWKCNDTIEEINSGSLQRIADSLEKMEKPFKQLLVDAQQYEKWYRSEAESNRKLTRRISALQGVITKMKKKSSCN
jgi:DNA anti-recombination protein RmuC